MSPLYHYCSSRTFVSMIEKKSIWLSSLSLSNDSMEGKVVAREFNRILEAEKVDGDVADQARYAMQFLQEFYDGLGFCLSGVGDLLSQWRGYADDGQGFSVGFSRKYLVALSEAQPEESQGFSLKEVLYRPDQHEAALKPIYEKIKSLMDSGTMVKPRKELIDLLYTSREFNNPIKRHNPAYDAVWKQVFPAIKSAYTLKSSAFSEEQEWRLVSHLRRDGGADARYRAAGNRVVPYREFSLLDLVIRAIDRVYVGPKNLTPDFVISGILNKGGFNGVEIVRSEATYR